VQRKAKPLHLLDEVKAGHVIGSVKTKLTSRPRCRGQQGAALVEPNRVNAQCGSLGSLADLDCALSVRGVPHEVKGTLCTSLQSEVSPSDSVPT
jgi:hypothetical protein